MRSPIDFRKSSPPEERPFTRLFQFLCPAREEPNPLYLWGRVLAAVLLGLYTIRFAAMGTHLPQINSTFMHLVNLPFHEAGHILFRPFGSLIASMGGSLFQLIVPLVVTLTFLFKMRNGFGAAVGFWWFGQSLVDLAPYINDARAMTLPLLGGNTGNTAPYGFHDWNYILSELNLVHLDRELALASFSGGLVIMILALLWGAAALYRQFER